MLTDHSIRDCNAVSYLRRGGRTSRWWRRTWSRSVGGRWGSIGSLCWDQGRSRARRRALSFCLLSCLLANSGTRAGKLKIEKFNINIVEFLEENHCVERKNNWFWAASNDPEIIICSFRVLTFMKYFPYLKLELSCQTLENMKHCSDHTGLCQPTAVSNPKLYFLAGSKMFWWHS